MSLLVLGAIAVVAILVLASQNSSGQSDSSLGGGGGGTGVSMMTAEQVAQVAQNAGWQGRDLTIAVAIALAESSGDPSAKGDECLAPAKGPSIGLWQINIGSLAHPEYANTDLKNPDTNARIAFQFYRARGFHDWSTYGDKSYLAFLNQAQDAIVAINQPQGGPDQNVGTPPIQGGSPCVPCIAGGEG